MYTKELIDKCNIIKDKKGFAAYSHPKNEIGNMIKASTQFLDYSKHNSMKSRIFHILNDICSLIKCPVCDNIETNILINKDWTYDIRGCSRKCSTYIDKTYINPETGNTNYVDRCNKGAHTKRQTINEHGENVFQLSGKKGSKTLNSINKDGITLSKLRSINQQKVVMTADEYGNYRAQDIAIKAAYTMTTTLVEGSSLTIAEDIGRQNSEHAKNGDAYIEGRAKQQYLMDLKKYPIISEMAKISNCVLLTSFNEYASGERDLKLECNKCGAYSIICKPYFRCIKCAPRSRGQHDILEYIQSLISNDVLYNDRKTLPNGKELDLYVPSHNFAIEYNGLLWHSFGKSNWTPTNNIELESIYKNKHLEKTIECEELKIQLFHIYEDEWEDPIRQAIWKSIIKNKLKLSQKIYARKTIIKEVDRKTCKNFYNINHLQGGRNYRKYDVSFGLYYNDELVSLISFSKDTRYKSKNPYDYELIRFCNKTGSSVIGGAGKLLKHFIKIYDNPTILSYATRHRSNGNLYNELGFKFLRYTNIGYRYFKGSVKKNSFNEIYEEKFIDRHTAMKHKLEKLLDVFDDNLTESENMYNNGYRKIYDCGNSVWLIE